MVLFQRCYQQSDPPKPIHKSTRSIPFRVARRVRRAECVYCPNGRALYERRARRYRQSSGKYRLLQPRITAPVVELRQSHRLACCCAAHVAVEVSVSRCERRRSEWTTRTISAAAGSISAITSWITMRTIRFFNRASVEGAVQTVLRSAASIASDAGSATGASLAASWAAILPSTSVTRASALFQRASSSPVTSRLAGSAASYCRKARSVA